MDPREATLNVADKSPFLLRDLLLAHAAQSERDDLQMLDASRGAGGSTNSDRASTPARSELNRQLVEFVTDGGDKT